MITGNIIRSSTLTLEDTARGQELAAQICPAAPLGDEPAHPILNALDDLGMDAELDAWGMIHVGVGSEPEISPGCYEVLRRLLAALAPEAHAEHPRLEDARIEWRHGADENQLWCWTFRNGAMREETGHVAYTAG